MNTEGSEIILGPEGFDTPETSYSSWRNPENPRETPRILAESPRILRNPMIFTPQNPQESPGIPWNPQASPGILRNPKESPVNPQESWESLGFLPLYFWKPRTKISKCRAPRLARQSIYIHRESNIHACISSKKGPTKMRRHWEQVCSGIAEKKSCSIPGL